MTTLDTTATVLDEVERLFDAVFTPVDGWTRAVENLVAERDGSLDSVTCDAQIERLVISELHRSGGMIAGAGFVAAPGFLADAPWHLAWWLRGTGASPGHRRLAAVEDPTSEDFRDYTALEWWRVPARTGERHITGPYVDYVCTDDYTLTLTQPVSWAGTLIGVVGADVYVTEAERVLLPALRRAAQHATIVNAAGRVVATTQSRRPTGSLLRIDGLVDAIRSLVPGRTSSIGPSVRLVSCGSTPLVLVIED